jgi:hypothetical protein
MSQPPHNSESTVRTFSTGATRSTDDGKPDYEGFLSPTVIRRFGEYMTKHRVQADGSIRASDNWQKGIPRAEYLKSLLRHVVDLWADWRNPPSLQDAGVMEDLCCAILFNAQGFLHETLAIRLRDEALAALSPSRRPCVYVSGPFSNGSTASASQRRANVQRAESVGRALANAGFNPHVPHAATVHLEDSTMTYEDFLGLDLSIIAAWAEAVYRMPGESVGADREVAFAKQLGLPVFDNLADIVRWRDNGRGAPDE